MTLETNCSGGLLCAVKNRPAVLSLFADTNSNYTFEVYNAPNFTNRHRTPAIQPASA